MGTVRALAQGVKPKLASGRVSLAPAFPGVCPASASYSGPLVSLHRASTPNSRISALVPVATYTACEDLAQAETVQGEAEAAGVRLQRIGSTSTL